MSIFVENFMHSTSIVFSIYLRLKPYLEPFYRTEALITVKVLVRLAFS